MKIAKNLSDRSKWIIILAPFILFVNTVLFICVASRQLEIKALQDVSTEVKNVRNSVKETLKQMEQLDAQLSLSKKSAPELVEQPKTSNGSETLDEDNKTKKSEQLNSTSIPEEQKKNVTLPPQVNIVHESKDKPKAEIKKENSVAPLTSLSSSINDEELAEWKANVCGSIDDTICKAVYVLPKKKVTFCSATEVYPTTTKQYFFDIAEGSMVIPDNAKFGVHEANWKRFQSLDDTARKFVLKHEEYTHIFLWRNVVERFVSGYFNKVFDVCEQSESIKPHFAISRYIKDGFSCQKHKDFDAFVAFMENLDQIKGHFRPQSTLCGVGKYPFTKMIGADENIDSKLEALSTEMGLTYTSSLDHIIESETIDKSKVANLFRGNPTLVTRILKIFEVDCINIPQACDVEELMTEIRTEVAEIN